MLYVVVGVDVTVGVPVTVTVLVLVSGGGTATVVVTVLMLVVVDDDVAADVGRPGPRTGMVAREVSAVRHERVEGRAGR